MQNDQKETQNYHKETKSYQEETNYHTNRENVQQKMKMSTETYKEQNNKTTINITSC